MSVQAFLGLGALVVAALVWAVGSAGLTYASAAQAFPRDRRGGWGRYVITYAATLVLTLAGLFTLAGRVGAWALVVMVAVFIPQWLVAVVRRRRAARRAGAGGAR